MNGIQKALPRLDIDLDSDVPVVHQITRGLRRCLLEGALAPGELLPSSRALARDLGVHFNTVAQAYRALEAEGWLALKRRAGSVVLERRPPALTPAEQERLAADYEHQLRDLQADFEARGLDRETLDQRTHRVLDTQGDDA